MLWYKWMSRWMTLFSMLQTGQAFSSLSLIVPAMSRSFKSGVSLSRCAGHAVTHFSCNLKDRMRMIPAPTSRHLSASNHPIPDLDLSTNDADGANVALLIALKGWRVMRKIASGRGGDLYQVAPNGTGTASPHVLRVLSVKAMQGEWWLLDALREEATVLKRLTAPGIPEVNARKLGQRTISQHGCHCRFPNADFL